jgi:hypothetical protein
MKETGEKKNIQRRISAHKYEKKEMSNPNNVRISDRQKRKHRQRKISDVSFDIFIRCE